ncbi:peroxiredoxin [Rhizobium halophytocola]|uniref:Peroxiredoxin n=1 Tax=Rhizobium halophytocola TaxID=735519 RepID=A0ABS4DTM1_9HYPH|nr:peroxiredoxin [Rhizobium halophytocola]MBP1848974.1 peroxiredoxin [Rhizobium halophytocola]
MSGVVDWSALPVPTDDGAARHLAGMRLPSVTLPSTSGDRVDLSTLAGLSVVYVYPMTAQPGVDQPRGWEMIAGARGCTPQSCAFRDHFAELKAAGADHLFGVSVQDGDWQREAVERLHLPYPLLSDRDLSFARALQLPSFAAGGQTLLKRLTMIVKDGTVSAVFYPVFPPDRDPLNVLDWLGSNMIRA